MCNAENAHLHCIFNSTQNVFDKGMIRYNE